MVVCQMFFSDITGFLYLVSVCNHSGFVAKRSVISLTLKDVEEELRFNGGGTYKPTAYRVFQGSTVAIMPAFLSDTPLKSFDEQCHVEVSYNIEDMSYVPHTIISRCIVLLFFLVYFL